jgi:hypothetical protein
MIPLLRNLAIKNPPMIPGTKLKAKRWEKKNWKLTGEGRRKRIDGSSDAGMADAKIPSNLHTYNGETGHVEY